MINHLSLAMEPMSADLHTASRNNPGKPTKHDNVLIQSLPLYHLCSSPPRSVQWSAQFIRAEVPTSGYRYNAYPIPIYRYTAIANIRSCSFVMPHAAQRQFRSDSTLERSRTSHARPTKFDQTSPKRHFTFYTRG